MKKNGTVGWCEPDAPTAPPARPDVQRLLRRAHRPILRNPSLAFCLRDCNGRAMAALLVRKGLAGIDCGESVALYSALNAQQHRGSATDATTSAPPPPRVLHDVEAGATAAEATVTRERVAVAHLCV